MEAIKCDICGQYEVRNAERSSQIVVDVVAMRGTVKFDGAIHVSNQGPPKVDAGHVCSKCEVGICRRFYESVADMIDESKGRVETDG